MIHIRKKKRDASMERGEGALRSAFPGANSARTDMTARTSTIPLLFLKKNRQNALNEESAWRSRIRGAQRIEGKHGFILERKRGERIIHGRGVRHDCKNRFVLAGKKNSARDSRGVSLVKRAVEMRTGRHLTGGGGVCFFEGRQGGDPVEKKRKRAFPKQLADED